MKKIIGLILVMSILTLGASVKAVSSELILSEVMPDPTGSDADFEWIELYNNSTATINISQWKLNGNELPDQSLAAGSYLILARNKSALTQLYPNTSIIEFSFSLPNGGTELFLDKDTTTEQVFSYGQSQTGKSFELLSGDCGTISINSSGDTAGAANNSCSQGNTDTAFIGEIYISRVLAAPASGQQEIVTLKNLGSESVDLNNWIIRDASGSKQLLTGTLNARQQKDITISSITLNNSGDTIKLYDSQNRQVDIFSYLESEKGVYSQISSSATETKGENSKNITSDPKQTAAICSSSRTSETDLDIPGLYRFKDL